VLTTNTSASQCIFELIASATNAYRILELGITNNAATAGVYGFGRPAATGVTPTTPVTVLAEDAGNTQAGQSNTALAWGTSPTTPTIYMRRVGVPAIIGVGMIWTFPRGVTVIKTLSTVVYNAQAQIGAAMNLWVVVDE